MVAEIAQIDLISLLGTGSSGPLELGRTDRDGIRAFFDTGDIAVDGAVHAPYSSWSIYAPNCEFFFNSEFGLKSFKLMPFLPKVGMGGGRVHWNGQFDILMGETTVAISGNAGIDILALPRALNTLRAVEHVWTIRGGDERDVYVEFQNSGRQLTLQYQLDSVAVDGDRGTSFEIDYWLSALWFSDQNSDVEAEAETD